jgi:hypothetical protein
VIVRIALYYCISLSHIYRDQAKNKKHFFVVDTGLKLGRYLLLPQAYPEDV